jgi:SAM-dependent methyltransferase
MRNEDKWRPTKFVERQGRWVGSRSYVGPASWLTADLAGGAYSDAIARHCKGRVIDVGCGPAPLYGMYRPHAASITCIDWDNSPHNISFCDTHTDLNERWDIPSQAFDTVIATDVLEHLHSPSTFFAEISRICAPGGKLILGVPFMYWIHEAPHDYLRHTEFSLRRLCKKSELEIVELSAYGGAPEVMIDIALKMLRPPRAIAGPLYALIRGVLRCPPVPSISRKSRTAIPLGYVLVASKAP